MKRTYALVVAVVGLFALSACSTAPARSGAEAKRSSSTVTVHSPAHRDRSYVVRLPPGHDTARKWPLVIALHGRMGTSAKTERMTHLSELADREGFVVVYPDGHGRSWNDARGTSPAGRADVDDVGFIREIIDAAIAERGVDPDRVYVVGASNGGMMAYRLACELGEKIAAVGPVIGLMPVNGTAQCKPAHPMPMMIIAGTKDRLVPYEGGDINGTVLSAEQTREWWARNNGCGAASPVTVIDPVDDGTRVLRTSHQGCKDDAEVVLLSVENGGHTWPNGPQYLPEALVGKVTHDIDGSEELWRFFKDKRRAARSPTGGLASPGGGA